MKLSCKKLLVAFAFAAAFSLVSTASLNARPYLSTSEMQPLSFADAIQNLQKQAIKVQDPLASIALNSIYKTMKQFSKGQIEQMDYESLFLLLDDGIAKCSGTPTGTVLRDLKRLVCKLSTAKGATDLHTESAINSVPMTIVQPGKYTVTRDLVYNGTGDAISIAANNVTIEFANHSLHVADPQATGIFATSIKGVTITNALISGSQQSTNFASSAIEFEDVRKSKIDNVYTENTFKGIFLVNSADATVINSHHTNHAIGIASLQSNKMLFDGCYIVCSPTSVFSGMAFAGFNDLNIQNCSVENMDATPGCDGILLSSGSAGLIEHVVINTKTSSQRNYTPAAIHVGLSSESIACSNITIRDALVQNQNDIGLFIDMGTNCHVENCQVSQSKLANIKLDSATVCTIAHNDVNNSFGRGIELTMNASNNSISSNQVKNNATGIRIAQGAKGNHVENNYSSGNTKYGIVNSEISTILKFNSSCNNAIDCSGPTALFPQHGPGARSQLPGSNLCCELAPSKQKKQEAKRKPKPRVKPVKKDAPKTK